MKKVLGIAAFLLYYFVLVPFLWHVDDANVFSQTYKNAAHFGAYIVAALPPTFWILARLTKKALQ